MFDSGINQRLALPFFALNGLSATERDLNAENAPNLLFVSANAAELSDSALESAGQSSKFPCTRRILDHSGVSLFAAEDDGLRVMARTAKSLVDSGEARSARITLRPWLPVAPVMRRALGIVSFATALSLIVKRFRATVDWRNAPLILMVFGC